MKLKCKVKLTNGELVTLCAVTALIVGDVRPINMRKRVALPTSTQCSVEIKWPDPVQSPISA